MIGPMSSSLALAQRTATKARATMDTMSRQIATGQKVSSVKDDGAAWARANSIRSSAIVDREAVAAVNRLDVRNTFSLTAFEGFLEGLRRVDSILLQIQGAPNPTARAALNAEMLAERENLRTIAGNSAVDGVTAIGYGVTGNLSIQTGLLLFDYDETGLSDTTGAAYVRPFLPNRFESLDMNTATAAQATSARTELAGVISTVTSLTSQAGRFLAGHEDLTRVASGREDLKLSLAASLTDADMGKASIALRQSETRQQLALSTIQQAISAYGNYAAGLLGNVQRTQRGLLV